MSSNPTLLDMTFDQQDPFQSETKTQTVSQVSSTVLDRTGTALNNNENTESDQKPSTIAEATAVGHASAGSGPRVPTTPMIHVDLRIVNMGMDIKLEDDPFQLTLNGIMKADDLVSEIQIINRELETCRATSVDQALLLMGPMMLPLIPYAIRKKAATKKRRKIMDNCACTFNTRHPDLLMRWVTRPEKHLVIMRRSDAEKEMNK